MKYYKTILDGHIVSISTGTGAIPIDEAEYNDILHAIRARPTDPEGYVYALKTDLSWELVEYPFIFHGSEATAEDYEAALNKLGVDV